MGALLHPDPAEAAEALSTDEPEPAVAVHLDGIEVTQAVQDLAHSVPLIAGKATVVRVYLSLDAGGDRAVTVGGELELHRGGERPARYLPAMATIQLDPSTSPTLAQRRGDAAGSLNFRLAEADVAAGPLTLRVGRITDAMAGRRLVLVERPGVQTTVTVGFIESPPLRLRVIGMRYTGRDGQHRSPRALDFALLLSWLGRAFPVASVEATQIVTDLPHMPPFTCGQVNALLAGTRNLDVATGTDPRTHYLALVYDAEATNFMQGCSSGMPAAADPTVVASSPAGVPRDGFGWDADGSYADWYGAHELAHTFGRLHPGFGGGQRRDDDRFPFPNGQISDGDTYVGFDVGDPSLSLPARALPGERWHDVMTYCEDQWISPHTYAGLRDRLIEEDTMAMPPAGPADPPGGAASVGPPNPSTAGAPMRRQRRGPTPQPPLEAPRPGEPLLNMIGRVNLTDDTAEILMLNPLPSALWRPPGEPSARHVTVRLIGAGDTPVDHAVPVRLDSCAGEGDNPLTGLVDVVVSVPADLTAVELRWEGETRARHEIPDVAPRQAHLKLEPAPPALEAAGAFAPGHRRIVSWEEHDETTRYHVQVSDDDGATWQTIAVNWDTPSVEIDYNQFRSSQLRVRVYATNGLLTEQSEMTIDLEA
ncbi:MAG: hypothetical protein ACRDYA_21005 [Egibacteraceae bacterium]